MHDDLGGQLYSTHSYTVADVMTLSFGPLRSAQPRPLLGAALLTLILTAAALMLYGLLIQPLTRSTSQTSISTASTNQDLQQWLIALPVAFLGVWWVVYVNWLGLSLFRHN